MDTSAAPPGVHERPPGWPIPAKIAFGVFLAIGSYFLWTEHRAHLAALWPLSFLLVCVVMHFFMHHGDHSEGESMSSMSSMSGTER